MKKDNSQWESRTWCRQAQKCGKIKMGYMIPISNFDT